MTFDLSELKPLMELVNLLLIPLIIYVIRIERRLSKGDMIMNMVVRLCPLFNRRSQADRRTTPFQDMPSVECDGD